MKAAILDKDGKKAKEVELPVWFSDTVREDIAQKFFEASKKQQAYGPDILAGKKKSASGKIRHGRRKWKTAYGRGISRVPRKIFWRRGTQFYWQAAFISSARGGRRAHHPEVLHFMKKKKINKKETRNALQSAFIATLNLEMVEKRYETLENIKLNLPLLIESEVLKLKGKDFYNLLKKILDGAYNVALKNKKVRAGKGKMRGRKRKENAGLLLILGDKEKAKLSGIDVKKVSELEISDLFPLGRLVIYTEEAIKQLGEIGKVSQEIKEKGK